MDPEYVQLILKAESAALEEMQKADVTDAAFTCPICNGEARITLHEWMGHMSSCSNGCF